MIIKALLIAFYFFLFHFLIYRFKTFRFRNFQPLVTHLLFTVKFITGIGIWVIYTFYYKDTQNNDVHKFYNDAVVLHEIRERNPHVFWDCMVGIDFDLDKSNERTRLKNWDRNFDEAPFNENRFIIRVNAWLMFVSFKTYFVHILFMCFFSLIGWVLLTNSIFSFTGARNAVLALPILFLPSVLFWTSGVMKEPMLVLGLGLLVSGLLISDLRLQLADIKRWQVIGSILLGAVIILFTKFFVLACMIPAGLAYLLLRNKAATSFIWGKYVVVNVLLLLLAFNIHYLIPRIDPQQMLANKQTHSVKEADYFQAGSRIEIPELTTNVLSTLKAAPVGVWNTLARPYLWEGKNVMMIAAIMENLFLIPFVLFCFAYIDWKNLKNLNLFLFLLNFSIAYFAVTGMCTPVLGNLVRYKAPVLPLYLFAFAIMVNPKMIARNLDFILKGRNWLYKRRIKQPR